MITKFMDQKIELWNLFYNLNIFIVSVSKLQCNLIVVYDINSSKSENNNFSIHRVARVKVAKGESLQSLWGLCLKPKKYTMGYFIHRWLLHSCLGFGVSMIAFECIPMFSIIWVW